MPPISCPVCNRQISDQAKACPGCGHPLRQTQYMTWDVTEVGWKVHGRERLQELLSEGWQITHEEYEDLGTDGDGYSRGVTHYDLRKE